MAQNEGSPLRIFISYRRKDSPGHAGRIRDVLRTRFGDDCVFYDVATIEGGVDFAVAIRDALEKASILVVIVGPHWSRRRLPEWLVSQPDWVRFEIESARQLAKPILPVLVAAAGPPASRSLHESIQFLASIQAVAVRDDSWDSDVKRLTERIPIVAATPVTLPPQPAHAPTSRAKRYAVPAALVVALGIGIWLVRIFWDRHSTVLPTPATAVVTQPAPMANRPPTVGKIEVQPTDGLMAATKFLFTAKGITDPDGDPLKYTWDFGDGSPAPRSAPTATKIYDRVNRFDVKLMVSDGKVAEDVLAGEAQVTVGDVTGTWDLTLTRDPAAAILVPTRYTITLTQQGNRLTGRIIPEGSTRSTALIGDVQDPDVVHFGSESAWWNDNEDAYFTMRAGFPWIQMSTNKRCGPALPCLRALANKQ